MERVDPVNHPPHYTADPLVECIDAAGHMPFPIGNALKYLVRAGRKNSDPREDVAKALWYLRWWYRNTHDSFEIPVGWHLLRRLAQVCTVSECAQVVGEMHGKIMMEDVENWILILEGVGRS